MDHFRPPPKRTLSRTLSRGGLRKKNELWAFGRVSLSFFLSWKLQRFISISLLQDPIKQPLLKKLLSHNDELQQKAVSSFLDILAYSCIF